MQTHAVLLCRKIPPAELSCQPAMCSERGNGGRSDAILFANSEIILRDFYFFVLFKEYCRQFFTILAGEGYIRFLTQRSKLEEVGACTQSEGSEFQSSMVLTKKEYLNVLFLGAYGLTVFE